MKYSSIPAARIAVQLCKENGIRNIVISPGSRNAPLTIGFTADPYFRCFSIVDERTAAFFAMGMAQQNRVPVVLVCTSGSALLNYFPAVAEAFYSEIPLIVLSADRPPHKVDIGDGQTIRQAGVYGDHVGFFGAFELDAIHASQALQPPLLIENSLKSQPEINERNQRIFCEALSVALYKNLPVHLNIPFEEPLYQTSGEAVMLKDIGPVKPAETVTLSMDSELDSVWKKASRILILVGVLEPGTLSAECIRKLAEDPNVAVLTETTSNLHHPDFFNSIDSIIAPLEIKVDSEERFRALQPDLLITLGGMVVSKKIKKFLRNFPPTTHWHVGKNRAYDTFFCLEKHISVAPEEFFRHLGTSKVSDSLFHNAWRHLKDNYLERRPRYISKIPFSDYKAFHIIFKNLPHRIQLHLANSSTIRYAQLFEMPPGIPVYCNRGTSGIEGSLSTAGGSAIDSELGTLVICGDLSFLYDKNGLWHNYLREDFRIIVINNHGGGIFRILPGFDGSENFETYFETVQHIALEPLCEMHGIEYLKASDAPELNMQLRSFFNPVGRPRLLEVETPREINEKILLEYFDFLS